jgi:hypothetical protein
MTDGFMTFNSRFAWALIAALAAFAVLLLVVDPRRLPRFLQKQQVWLTGDFIRLFKSSAFFETAKSFFEASLFAGPTYYGVVQWISAREECPMMTRFG